MMRHIKIFKDYFKGAKFEVKVSPQLRKEFHECAVGCPYYSSGHSIDANGNCNLGCC